jgi:hypothetical protein
VSVTGVTCEACGEREATCRGKYEGDDRVGYACDECCAHGNEDGWCEVLHPLPEPTDTEPGPGRDDVKCICGCDGAALYTCSGEDVTGDFAGRPYCAVGMRDAATEAKEFGFRFKATPFGKPQPLEHTCVQSPELVCDRCTLDFLKRARELRGIV